MCHRITVNPSDQFPEFARNMFVGATSRFAALVFIGFDGVSILAEEVKNPKRNVLLAAVLVCVFTGLFSGLQVYLAQRVWPDYTTLRNPETAFMDVARVAGGPMLFTAYGLVLLVSSLACGLAGHVGAARLLYSMGRDDVLPKKIFSHLNPKKGNPVYNEMIVGGGRLCSRPERSVATRCRDRHFWRAVGIYRR